MRRFILLAWLLFLAACVALVANTRFTADMSAFLPAGATPEQRLLVMQLREGATARLLLVGIGGAEPERLAAASRALAGRLRGNPRFALVANGELALAPAEREFVSRHRYVLSPAVDAAHFSVAALRQSLEESLALLGSEAGILVKRILPADPTGETLRLIEALASDGEPRREQGVWFSRDGRAALLVVQTRAPAFDTDAQQNALDDLQQAFAQARGAAKLELEFTGPAVFALASRHAIERDATLLSMTALALVALLLWWAYRAPRILGLAVVPVASGALAGIATVSAGFGFVHGITLGFGTTMIGEAVDYAIYFFAERRSGNAARGVERIWPTLRLGTLTSVCGFSAMLLSGFPGLAQLGVYSVAGLAVALLVTRWVLPLLAGAAQTDPAAEGIRTAWCAKLLARLPRARTAWPLVIVVTGLAAAWLAIQRAQLWEADLANLSPASASERARDERLRGELGAPDVRLLLVVRGASEQAALEGAEALAPRLDAWKAQGLLRQYDSPARYLPSLALQKARRDALPDVATLRARLGEALRGLPFAPGVFEPFLADVAAAKAQGPIDARALAGTAFALKLEGLLIRADAGYAALLPLSGVSDPARLAQAIAALPESRVTLLDLKQETTRLLDDYRHEAMRYALLGAALIALLLAAMLRSPLRVVRVLAPLAAAVSVTCALLNALGERLSLFHLVALLLVVGVGSNYALFFERPEADATAQARTAGTLALCSATTIVAFGLLAFSATPVLHAIGLTVAIGAFASLAFSAVIAREID